MRLPWIKLVEGIKTEDGQLLFGRVHSTKPLIEIESTLDLAMQWQVLWHELVHAFLSNLGLRDHDEQTVDSVARQINGVLLLNGSKLVPTE